ncbi:MAG TPA: nucleoside-diphosphate sugar epimerase/dehydratase [Pyrinomonadaceae bacterium]|nr:nucleoside-diphosphate sugar epimerase/dehydratase [Pyrinomonadaceae bacterium]
MTTAFFLAYFPAINIRLDSFVFEPVLTQVSFVVFVQVSTLFLLGAYSIIWRYISIGDVKVFAYAALASGGILLALRFLLNFTTYNIWQIPISVITIDTILGFGGLLGLRVLRRFLYELGERKPGEHRRVLKKKRALLAGAGRTGATLVREIAGRGDSELEIWGFVDDDARLKGGLVSGFKVLGPTDDLPRFIDEIGVEEVVITLDNASGKEIRRIVDLCSALGVKTQIVPSLDEFARGKVAISRLRDVQIDDILGREQVILDSANLAGLLSEKTVLVTGAGGSIGSELVRQIANFTPKSLLLLERAEYAMFEITSELSEIELQQTNIVPLIADVCDLDRVRQIFSDYRPDVVFHAAAHKHVSLMEGNVAEAVKNNAIATSDLGRLAGESGVTHFVLISTDKAVNPTSVMGASKRLGEIAVQDLNRRYDTKFVAVRFGNVLGSAGSVVPIFKKQIRKGGPVKVTDAEMTRYFMTIPEASQLVLQAAALGSGGEIFVLDMGEPVKILDLAKDMIRLSGLIPFEDIDIVFTGVRQGEKLFEELEMTGEDLERTRHPKIFIGKIATFSTEEVGRMFSAFRRAVEANDEIKIRWLFNQMLAEASITSGEYDFSELTLEEEEKFFAQASLGSVAK